MSGISSAKKTPHQPKLETELQDLDILLSDVEGIRKMPFFGVVPDLEKYADLPELKKTASRARDGFMLFTLKKIKHLFS